MSHKDKVYEPNKSWRLGILLTWPKEKSAQPYKAGACLEPRQYSEMSERVKHTLPRRRSDYFADSW